MITTLMRYRSTQYIDYILTCPFLQETVMHCMYCLGYHYATYSIKGADPQEAPKDNIFTAGISIKPQYTV
jgi:hypothetical protein